MITKPIKPSNKDIKVNFGSVIPARTLINKIYPKVRPTIPVENMVLAFCAMIPNIIPQTIENATPQLPNITYPHMGGREFAPIIIPYLSGIIAYTS